ncbi:hypothetical protein PITCH_A1580031 [uncultured Desulfobacterium sp.]|uniref:Uncharacterized protein n=1 Tax=uncultured Desulfobacterium sp. TaxID=201089 RepID=A0A445MTT3_9BACT|nr:hypothetical protein PITCH_A1580031 [uncultured Desulfobacterium sp.]
MQLFVYEDGALERQEKGQASVIKKDVIEKARRNNFEIIKVDCFRSCTGYFTDS